MTKRAAIELSTTFLIGLIFGIILLSFGLIFFANILSSVDEIKTIIPDGCKVFAEQCSDEGKQICIYETQKELDSKHPGTYCLVVNNLVGTKKSFKTNVVYSTGVLSTGSTAPSQTTGKWTFPLESISIENNDFSIIGIPIVVPGTTKPGRYVFNVNVCYDGSEPSSKCSGSQDSLYATTRQITVIVN